MYRSVCLALPFAAFLLSMQGCRTDTPVTTAAAFQSPAIPNDIRWFRTSAERPLIYEEIYRQAGDAARAQASGRDPNSWGVILDVDETVLDNSEEQARQAGKTFDSKAWNAWVLEARAPRLPGAKEFIDLVVDQLKGRVVLVTNRSIEQCPATMANLRTLRVRYERVLCNDSQGDKNIRFRRVIQGESGFSPMNVLLWLGDNIQDFPDLTQQAPGDHALFGIRYFVFPNPMYGSWQPK